MEKERGLKISVAGIRGRYPNELDPIVTFKYSFVFGIYAKNKTFLVGRDTRKSGEVLLLSAISGLLSAGKNVINLGIIPTPLMEYIVEKHEKKYGVLVTASHNPEEYNGLKFLNKSGTFLNQNEWKEFSSFIKNLDSLEMPSCPGTVKISNKDFTEIFYKDIYFNIDINKIKRKKFKVVVDACQGVSSFYTEKFLKEMGCEVVIFNKYPPGKFAHDPEPLVKNLKYLKRKVIEEKADIGFMQDPDCDRLGFVCEDGYIPSEEITLALCVDSILEKEKTAVVVNLSTTSLIDDICEKHGVKIYRTKVGEINVVEKMKRVRSRVGGEGNGGVIWGKVHYGRDSFVAMALILEKMAKENKKISEIVKTLPEYFMIKEKYRIENPLEFMEKVKDYFKGEKIDTTDGVKVIRENGWIHIRPSGTEPVVRIIIEGKNKKVPFSYLEELKNLLLRF